MIEPDANSNRCVRKNGIVVFFAALLIVLGLVLQWTELLFTHVVTDNAWFFATLFGEIWNIINLSPSAAQWHESFYYWPLLLVIIGAAILFSRCNEKLRAN